MEKRVEILSNRHPFDLQDEINGFLEETNGRMHDVKIMPDNGSLVAMIIYTPEEETA